MAMIVRLDAPSTDAILGLVQLEVFTESIH
jgi:hypothetical protein